MSGINKAIIVGRLGQDPEVKFMPSGDAVANLSLATSEKWKDKQTGEPREATEWHRVVIFGKLAEIAGEYLKKGSNLYVEGKLKTRKWTDQQGVEKYTTEIVLDGFNSKMEMLDSKPQGGQQQGGFQQQGQAPQQSGGFQGQQQATQQNNVNQNNQGGFQQQAAPQQQRPMDRAVQQNVQQNQQQAPKVNPQGPSIDFDDTDIPF